MKRRKSVVLYLGVVIVVGYRGLMVLMRGRAVMVLRMSVAGGLVHVQRRAQGG